MPNCAKVKILLEGGVIGYQVTLEDAAKVQEIATRMVEWVERASLDRSSYAPMKRSARSALPRFSFTPMVRTATLAKFLSFDA